MSSNQEPLEEATLVNQRQQIEQQVEQAAVQTVEQFVEQAPVVEEQTCPTCGRLGFRGARGLAIHRRKNRHCQELCRKIQQLPGVEIQAAAEDFAHAEDRNTQQEFIIDNDVLLDAILVAEAQQVLPIYIVLLITFRDTVYEFFKGLGRCCLWFLKLLYNLMILSIGVWNIYFVYIYCFENYRPSSMNKFTYLISPNFKEEFTIM